MKFKQIALSAFSFGYGGGFAGNKSSRQNPSPLTLDQLIAMAAERSLGGIEIPLSRYCPDLGLEALKALKEKLDKHGLFITIDSEVFDPAEFKALLPALKLFNAKLVRTKMSKVLAGERRELGMPWSDYLGRMEGKLKEARQIAKDNGVKIVIENHQDVTSDDLLSLIQHVGEDVLGVNYDTGSALAVCEDPYAAAEKLLPYIHNIHLKDYRIHATPSGFRLVRSVLGRGCVDFSGIFSLIDPVHPNMTAAIELGAVEARHVRWLDEGYWRHYPARTASEMLPFFKTLSAHQIREQGEEWKTLWEKGAPHEELIRAEIEEFKSSVDYLRSIIL